LRLFAALDLDEATRNRFAAVARKLRDAPGIRWTSPESLHITLRFFGEWPEGRLPELTVALESVRRPDEPVAIRFARLTFLPNERAPKIFIAVAETPKLLAEFQSRIEAAARVLGFEPEQRAFLTHVTLGRMRDPRQGRKLVEPGLSDDGDLGAFTPQTWGLYRSETKPTGAVYTKLAGWRLNSERAP
jgi:2'-5' RNA ligase